MKILLPIDLSRTSGQAIQFVSSRKTLLGSRPQIYALAVQPKFKRKTGFLFGSGSLDAFHDDYAERVFTWARKIFKGSGAEPEEISRVGVPDEEIAAVSREKDADLIVMGTRGLGSILGLFKNSVSTGVIEKSVCPVLLVRRKTPFERDDLNVAIAVDGSAFGETAVKYVLKHRKLFGNNGTFTAINVVNDYNGASLANVTGMAVPTLTEREVQALEKKDFNAAMSPIRPLFAEAGIPFKEVCLAGNPADELSAYCEKNGVDLLITGSHGYSRLMSAVLGSTAQALAAAGTVPVMIIRRPGEDVPAV